MTLDKKLPFGEISPLVCKNVVVGSHRTSIRMSKTIWDALDDICSRESRTVNEILTEIAGNMNGSKNLTSAVRVHVLLYFREKATEQGHAEAGHGTADGYPGGQAVPVSLSPALQAGVIN